MGAGPSDAFLPGVGEGPGGGRGRVRRGEGRWPRGAYGSPGRPVGEPNGGLRPSGRLAPCQALTQSSSRSRQREWAEPGRQGCQRRVATGVCQGLWGEPALPPSCSQMSFCPPGLLVPELRGIPRLLSYRFLLTLKYFLLRERGRGAKVRKEQIKTHQNKLPLPQRKLTSTHHGHTNGSPLDFITLLEQQPDRTQPHLPFW